MTKIEWFDDLTVGVRLKSGEARITAQKIKRFAAASVGQRAASRYA